jgi:hypothetical protein
VPVKVTFFARANTLSELEDEFFLSGERRPGKDVQVPRVDPETGRFYVETFPAADYLRAQISKIFQGPEVELATEPDARSSWLFTATNFLQRYQQLRFQTDSLLTSPWTDLFVVAESGAWLCEERMLRVLEDKPDKGRIFLITASDEGLGQWHLWRDIRSQLQKTLEKLRETGYGVFEARIPWWKHNRHFTLSVEIAPDVRSYQFIYFRRRLKTSVIAPVYGKGEAGCPDWAELLLMFMNYVKRACVRARQRGEEGLMDLGCAHTIGERVLERFEGVSLPATTRERARHIMSQLRSGAAR